MDGFTAVRKMLLQSLFPARYLSPSANHPNELRSWCSWTQGVPSLLPTTDLIAFVWDLNSARKTALVKWSDAERLVGHYFTATQEDPPRTRVDAFPTPDELIELQKLTA